MKVQICLGLKATLCFAFSAHDKQTLLLIGSTWGLMVEMAHYVDLTKKSTVTLEIDQIAQTTLCFSTGAYLLKATRPADSRPPAM